MGSNYELFDQGRNASENLTAPSGAPLAHRMRPQSLDEFLGQEQVLAPGKPLRGWIESDRVPSLIFWGPPGCGKTTLAQIIAKNTRAQFENLSAVLAGVKEIKEVVSRAQERLRLTGRKTILFVDEIHRFNKSQQDALLPHVENGSVTLIGATTENPSFELNTALLSRCRVIRFERLSVEAISQAIRKALEDPNRGLGGFFDLTEEAQNWLAHQAEGDVRRALGALEAVALLHPGVQPGGPHPGAHPFKSEAKSEAKPEAKPEAESALQGQSDSHLIRQSAEVAVPLGVQEVQAALESALARQPIPYDKSGEEHYNVISAFIKSIRDSDPDAAVYYLARMLEGGEDPLFIARRLVILASEDIGNADPRALQVAISVKEAVDFVGMPEARICLSQAVTYLAVAPKSNASYEAISLAQEEVRNTGALPVPMHLRNAVTGLMKGQGYGKGYRYPHAEGKRTGMSHLPQAIKGKRFYSPKDSGLEIQIKERMQKWDSMK